MATGSLVCVCNIAVKVCVHIAYLPPFPLLVRVSGSSMPLIYRVVESVLLILLPLPPDFWDYGLVPPPLTTTLQILLPLPSLARIIKSTVTTPTSYFKSI